MSDVYKIVAGMGVLIALFLIITNREGSVGVITGIGGQVKNTITALQGKG